MTLPRAAHLKPTASRVQGARKVLGELFRLKEKAQRALEQRAQTIEEKAWLTAVVDELGALISSGGKCLPVRPDPVETRRVRKRTTQDLAGFRADQRWMVEGLGE